MPRGRMNANTIPVCAWAIMEFARDPALHRAVRDEATTAYTTNESGRRVLDAQKLLALPLLQSVYTEAMRLHVSINVTREVVAPLEVEGYTLAPGSILQAPTEISHYQESVWGVEGHPAAEFWAERHVRYADEPGEDGKPRRVARFEMAGRPTDFFPFGASRILSPAPRDGLTRCCPGGGISVCPGRHFAKQEIMLTIAMLACQFDVEFVEWLNFDGSVSDRPPLNDTKYSGAAGVPPDRDLKLRWKRLW